MQRRTLISQALVSSVALLGGRLSMAARPDHQIDALVIGAGLAGLACTQQLMAAALWSLIWLWRPSRCLL